MRVSTFNGISGATKPEASAIRLITSCAALPSRVRGVIDARPVVTAGAQLAAHHLASTTEHKPAAAAVEPWWSTAGVPAIFLEYEEADNLVLPPHSRAVSSSRVGAEVLHYAWLQVEGQRCSVWLLRSDAKGASQHELRRLRIHLLRLHAERECLRLVLQAISESRIAIDVNVEQADRVQEYLDDAMPIVSRSLRGGVEQSQILEVARDAVGIAIPGQAASFNSMRRQLAEKVTRYIRRSEISAPVITNVYGDQMNTHIQLGTVTIGGDFNLVTAHNIQSSFNKAAGAEIAPPLKEALKKLTVEVASLAKQLPTDVAERTSKDLEVLTSEAVSKNPRKDWCELSAKGLLDAAKTVTKLTVPVTTAVKAVLAFLA